MVVPTEHSQAIEEREVREQLATSREVSLLCLRNPRHHCGFGRCAHGPHPVVQPRQQERHLHPVAHVREPLDARLPHVAARVDREQAKERRSRGAEGLELREVHGPQRFSGLTA
ncbi:hypothetical protein [Polyangium mundeleinium]|uniref:Uncharacterized protein n=1 Tax=Polyangium mundeleinium TaxID=2995306 RepID=A0ABT5ELK2_9BACT|nr:hypothetical protein [Polyangium mundeleinium]MDC0742725.1 hypothetical protein [Polyangium mundeleinium]